MTYQIDPDASLLIKKNKHLIILTTNNSLWKFANKIAIFSKITGLIFQKWNIKKGNLLKGQIIIETVMKVLVMDPWTMDLGLREVYLQF